MNRRTACFGLAGSIAFLAGKGLAQVGRPVTIAWVSVPHTNRTSPFFLSFLSGMQDHGWNEGREFAIRIWHSDNSVEQLKAQISQIVASRPDVIVSAGGPTVRVLIDAQVEVPIVFTYSADVVIGRIVESWARPGVNRTGVSFFSLELVPKRLQLIKEVFPKAKKVGFFGWPKHAGEQLELAAAQSAAAELHLDHQYHGANTAEELDAGLHAVAEWGADAILAFYGSTTVSHIGRFAAFTSRTRIPAVSAWSQFAEAGNLMSYGPVMRDAYSRLAALVVRVLNGTKPAEIPVEQPTKLELVINLKVAASIGIDVPPSVLARADRLLE
jgi:putative tryptophan/tyrosine transport system substrate-binding protein